MSITTCGAGQQRVERGIVGPAHLDAALARGPGRPAVRLRPQRGAAGRLDQHDVGARGRRAPARRSRAGSPARSTTRTPSSSVATRPILPRLFPDARVSVLLGLARPARGRRSRTRGDPCPSSAIVDADCHILEPPDIWKNWLPEKYQDKAPKLVKDHEGGDAWLTAVGGDPDPIGLVSTPGMPFDQFRWFGVTYEEARTGCYNGAARLKDMDIDGVWAEILFPPQRTMSHFLGDDDDDFVLAGVEAYNNFLFEEFCAPDPTRLDRAGADAVARHRHRGRRAAQGQGARRQGRDHLELAVGRREPLAPTTIRSGPRRRRGHARLGPHQHHQPRAARAARARRPRRPATRSTT